MLFRVGKKWKIALRFFMLERVLWRTMIGILCLAGVLWAEIAVSQHRQTLLRESLSSTRSKGMAGTGLGMIQGGEAGFLNPALIGGLPGQGSNGLRSLSFPSLSVGSTEGSLNLADKVVGSDPGNADLKGMIRAMGDNQGASFRHQLFPNLVYGRLLFGLLQTNMVDVQTYRLREPRQSIYLPESQGPSVDRVADVFLRSSLAGVFGFAVPMGRRATFGVSGRYGLRTTALGTAERAPESEAQSTKAILDNALVTQGYNADAGIYVSLAAQSGIGLSLVGRNLGEGIHEPMDKKSTATSEAGKVTEQQELLRDPSDLDFGLSWAPVPRRGDFAFGMSLEALGLLREDLALDQKIRLGGEFALGQVVEDAFLVFRAGHDLRGPSFGVAIDAVLFRLEGAYYNTPVHLPNGASRDESSFLLRTSWDLNQP
jgi:hypothetical protein